MTVPDRLLDTFRRPGSVDLDEALLVLASCRPDATVDVDARRGELDQWAGALPEATLDDLRVLVYDRLGFVGDVDDYHDPANSYLDAVMDRRQGMPITLAAVVLCLARRSGIALEAVGMPGHFLVRDQISGHYLDPFDRLAVQTPGALRDRLALLGMEPSPQAFAAADDRSIVCRVLNNLTNSFVQRDARNLDWVLDLRLALPAETQDLGSLVTLCEQRGRWNDAARLLEHLADNAERDHLARRAHALRSRLN